MVTFKPGPVQESIESAPKRNTPKAGPGRPSTRSLKSELSGLLMTLNLAIMMIPPLSRDQMDMVEIEALADALDEQARKSPKFRKALESALAAGSGGTLIGIMAIMGARRAARHGMIGGAEHGPEIDQQLGNMLAQGMDVSRKARENAGLA
jgi:hypothetical protein